MNSAAAICPPADLVNASHRSASLDVHTPCELRVPSPVAKDVSSSPFTACTKSMTPFHSRCVRTLLNPAGALAGGFPESAKYTVFAHVPLTRTYAGLSAAASFRRRGFERSTGGRY